MHSQNCWVTVVYHLHNHQTKLYLCFMLSYLTYISSITDIEHFLFINIENNIMSIYIYIYIYNLDNDIWQCDLEIWLKSKTKLLKLIYLNNIFWSSEWSLKYWVVEFLLFKKKLKVESIYLLFGSIIFDGSYLPTPLLGQDVTQGQIFKRSLTGLNSEFSFS